MKRWIIAIGLAVLAFGRLAAQDATGTLTNTGDVVSVPIVNAPSATVTVAGAWVGVALFEYAVDGTWRPLTVSLRDTGEITQATATNGVFVVTNAGLQGVRLRAGAFQSGSATVTVNRGFAVLPLPTGAFCNGLLHAAGKC